MPVSSRSGWPYNYSRNSKSLRSQNSGELASTSQVANPTPVNKTTIGLLGLALLMLIALLRPLDAAAAELSVRNYNANEFQRTANVTIELSEPATSKVLVHFSTSADTATPGQDFYGTYEILEFEAGDTKKQVPITILNDTALESDETFNATIWGVQGDNVSIARSNAVITIVDDDADGSTVPVISIDSDQVNENAGSIDVSISLSNPAPRVVSLIFATDVVGSATQGEDYYGIAQDVRFAIGETEKTVTITLLDDDVREGNEEILLNLHNVFGAALGTTQATVTLIDDEGVGTTPAALQAHVLNRLGYGASRYSTAQIESLGVDGYIESQLTRAPGSPLCELCREEDVTKVKMARAVSSQRQLSEILVDFWFNHFNVDVVNNVIRYDLALYENERIRNNVYAKFENMLLAVAKAPAMLLYLDNRSSTKEGLVIGGRERGLNENYARELMELHTLGVNGGYSEADVISVARILTGWTIRRGDNTGDTREFYFNSRFHDTDAKTVLNDSFVINQNEGRLEGEKLLRFLAKHPSTARYISSKLIQRFVSETPPPALVDAAADTWIRTEGNLREVLRTILQSSEFVDPSNFGSKIKSPIHLLASATRAMNHFSIPESLATTYNTMLIEQGQEMYEVAPPTGVPENSNYWVSSAAMLARFESIKLLVEEKQLRDGVSVSDGDANSVVSQIIDTVMPQGVSDNTRSAVVGHLNSMDSDATLDERKTAALTLLLSSPDFMRH